MVVLLLLGACGFRVPAEGVGDAALDDRASDATPACYQARCRRMTISIDHTRVVAGPHAAFPLYIDVTDPALGRDAVFTAADGTTVLPYEREVLRGGNLLAWVRVPSMSSATNTAIQLYFGDPTAIDTQDRAGVWDAGYQGVWHLGETVGGAAAITDSTSHGNAGTDLNGLAIGVVGKLGRAIQFDGTDDCLRIAASTSLASTAATATFGMWVNWTTPVPADYQRLLMSANTFAGDGSGMEWATNPQSLHYYYPSAAGGADYAAIQEPFVAGAWHHLVLTQDLATKTVRFFVDGAEPTKVADGAATLWTTLTTMADWYWGGQPPRAKFFGMMDELRTSNVVRSPGWIATEFANQSSPTTFYSIVTTQP